jgi:AraC-like DNA-binding protein
MNTSARSLHRQLQKEDIAYQDILNEVRKTLAEKYLLDPANSVTDIAFKLGYNDASNFARAFKRWSGMSPNEFKGANQST